MTNNLSKENALRDLYVRVGRLTRTVGFLFIVASLVFLLLSLWSPNVVFQIDSVASFLAAMILLLRDPRSRAQTRVFDAIMMSTDMAIAQLSAQSGSSFIYTPEGKSVSEVIVVASAGDTLKPGKTSPASSLIPPGRTLAELFVRESGMQELSLEGLKNSIEPLLTDNFGLADSVRLDITPERAAVELIRPATKCAEGGTIPKGVIGCPVASFLAVLFAEASGRQVVLNKCEHDLAADQWIIAMEFGKA